MSKRQFLFCFVLFLRAWKKVIDTCAHYTVIGKSSIYPSYSEICRHSLILCFVWKSWNGVDYTDQLCIHKEHVQFSSMVVMFWCAADWFIFGRWLDGGQFSLRKLLTKEIPVCHFLRWSKRRCPTCKMVLRICTTDWLLQEVVFLLKIKCRNLNLYKTCKNHWNEGLKTKVGKCDPLEMNFYQYLNSARYNRC